MNPEIITSIKAFFKGDLESSDDTLTAYSHDASLFEVRPQLIAFPKDADDVKALMRFVHDNKSKYPDLSITPRSAGTDMSGGPLNASIILDFTRYINKIIEVTDDYGIVEPGCYYRDFEKETLKRKRIMPAFTASKEICAVGGMVANNSGGEKNIKYGKTERYVEELHVILTDGSECIVKPLTENELKAKIADKSEERAFENGVYRKVWQLISANKEEIMVAKPQVSKNSAGYYLWNVWDEQTKMFNLCRLIVGSQGTLGIVTRIKLKLVPVAPFSNVLAIFLPDLSNLGKLVAEIVPFQPDSLESYDDASMKLAVRFFFDFITYLGPIQTIALGLRFLPEAWMMLTGGIPKLTVIVEITGETEAEVRDKLETIKTAITHFGYKMHVARNSGEAEKYWKIRRESFNLLRKHVHGQRTAPFIDDIIVPPQTLPEFLPRMQALIKEYNLVYTIAGHAGDGNFHIIPLMDLTNAYSTEVILDLSKKVYDLVHEFKGSITAEHNDGIIRTPYLLQMYGQKIIDLFKQTKEIFDPLYILNPKKKVGGTFQDIRDALSHKDAKTMPKSAQKHSS